MKTKEELESLKSEVENVNKKLSELSEDELQQVVGGQTMPFLNVIRGKVVTIKDDSSTAKHPTRFDPEKGSIKFGVKPGTEV